MSDSTHGRRPTQRLDEFDKSTFDRGRPYWCEALWRLTSLLLFEGGFPFPSGLKARALRLFGAEVGTNLYIRQRVYIHFPWRLELGDHVWIGEDCHLLNLAPLTIMSHTALGHGVFLAAAGHDTRSGSLRYRNAPVVIEGGCWLMSRCFVGPGVTVGQNSVVKVGAVVDKDVPASTVMAGNPAVAVHTRVVDKP
jgi:putative colanic acid biosynthesis acetyltransferase WcaF